MTFGLKNAGATYQRAMNYIFHEIIGKIVEIYIDDVVVKSKGYQEHLADLRKALECTRRQGLKMNLLTQDDHTPSPGAPYAKPGLH